MQFNGLSSLAPRNSLGFTLIELMITVAIVAILASIAYPSYQAYIVRGQRVEGKSALLDAAARMERSYSDNNQYPADVTTLVNATTENNYYTIAGGATGANSQAFTITATPIIVDAGCNVLSLTNTGAKGENGTLDVPTCWGK